MQGVLPARTRRTVNGNSPIMFSVNGIRRAKLCNQILRSGFAKLDPQRWARSPVYFYLARAEDAKFLDFIRE